MVAVRPPVERSPSPPPPASTDDTFTKEMRRATREVHSLSDALINAKLGVAMGSNRVWAEGLLVFYEVFKFLEEAMDRNPNSELARLDIAGVRRTELFEQDLCYYLGPGWRQGYKPRPSVVEYLRHLSTLEHTQHILLVAYAYHLYMGLLSGGQILRRKRAIMAKLKFSSAESYEGLAVTYVKRSTLYNLKRKIVTEMNDIADQLDEDIRELLIEESKQVFRLNDTIVRSITGTTSAVLWKLFQLSAVVGIVGYFVKKFVC